MKDDFSPTGDWAFSGMERHADGAEELVLRRGRGVKPTLNVQATAFNEARIREKWRAASYSPLYLGPAPTVEVIPPMSKTDYRRGFEDGKAFARSKADALKGLDRTQYEFIGGPKNGERIETRGSLEFFTPIMAPYSFPLDEYLYPYGPLNSIRRGRYQREEITQSGRKRTVYIYQGEE